VLAICTQSFIEKTQKTWKIHKKRAFHPLFSPFSPPLRTFRPVI